MTLLTKDAILSVDDMTHEDVAVPEWGGTVRVKSMTGYERDAWERSVSSIEDGQVVPDTRNARAKLAARVLVDEDGRRLFSDEEVMMLSAKSAKPLDRIFDVASRLSGLGKQAEADAVKNSPTPDTDSPSA